MFTAFNLNSFITAFVTRRLKSLLVDDLARFHDKLSQEINGSRVLVIGGAGTIGSHYIKALLRFKPAKLIVCDTNENGLTELVRDLRSDGTYNIPTDFIPYPVNFGDPVFAKLFAAHGPFDIVANFAAHKHVRSEKDMFSIEAMIENNVLRAKTLLDLLLATPPKHFFCVSTDKAANPVNIMGASKKLMEELILAYADRIPIKTARFANVAFSNGSLPLGFLDRLNKRQPWSCPKNIRRFFVSPIESGELCLLASIIGESGDIVFPKLDEHMDMIPLEQVATDLLIALGFSADICASEDEARTKMAIFKKTPGSRKYPIYFFDSDTSGEKTFEEFFVPGEALDLDTFVHLGAIKNAPRRPVAELDAVFADLRAVFAKPKVSKAELVSVLKQIIPNFEHIETGKSLDQKM